MAERIEFETPENVQVSYEVAGLGSRCIAWIIDSIILGMGIFVLVIVVLAMSSFSEQIVKDLGHSVEKSQRGGQLDLPFYLYAIIVLVSGFSNLLYYGLSELLMRGQTIGKRQVNLRVVKANGFALDGSSLFLRNVFRVIDHIPVLWVVPFVSQRSQRLGDMIAGTLVVKDATSKIGTLREMLLNRPADDLTFQFSGVALQRLRVSDFEAVEKFLERSASLKVEERDKLLHAFSEPLAKRLEVEPPDAPQRMRFLQDLLTAEFRRQYRQLG
jgi:uncharacterized RDD family membrane protein YckC